MLWLAILKTKSVLCPLGIWELLVYICTYEYQIPVEFPIQYTHDFIIKLKFGSMVLDFYLEPQHLWTPMQWIEILYASVASTVNYMYLF